MTRVLIIGASGQLGSELTIALGEVFGNENIIASDISSPHANIAGFTFEKLDVMNAAQLKEVVEKHSITQIYHLAAILSAKGESNPQWAWDLNMTSLLNVFELAKEKKLDKIYWPSSIAVFGQIHLLTTRHNIAKRTRIRSMELANWRAKDGANTTSKSME